MLQVGMKLVLKLIAGTACAGAVGTAPLNHKVGDDAVKRETIIKAFLGKFFKVGAGVWRLGIKKFQFDVSTLCGYNGCFHEEKGKHCVRLAL